MANVSLSLALIAWISKKSKCSVSKLVNWQMTYMIFFWIMFNVICFREFCVWLSYLEYEK